MISLDQLAGGESHWTIKFERRTSLLHGFEPLKAESLVELWPRWVHEGPAPAYLNPDLKQNVSYLRSLGIGGSAISYTSLGK